MSANKIYENPDELRRAIRLEDFTKNTSSQCPQYIQANMAILPSTIAKQFLEFCQLNPGACSILEMLPAGSYQPTKLIKTSADIRTDLPRYRIYQNGKLIDDNITDIRSYWNNQLVTFLLGCSFSFEHALQQNGIRIRNIDEKKNVSMYKCWKKKCPGPFEDVYLVVSMRPIRNDQIDLVKQITGHPKFAKTHGEPLYCGYNYVEELGIHEDLSQVDFGDAVSIDKQTETPCFWYCGVTAIMAAIEASKIDHGICITHSPGHMFVSDIKDDEEISD